jgi:transforming growth factor-beta-induced protein
MHKLNRRALGALLVPALTLGTAACGDESDPAGPEITADIVDIATSTPQVTTLAAAIEAAGLEEALRGSGPFTVFAPVNDAFAALGDEVLANLLDPANLDLLATILTYHVVPGAVVEAGQLSDGQTLRTIQGDDLTIELGGGSVTVNGANVITADIQATNGVIHLIDGVLVPELDVVETALVTPQTQTLAAALAAADLTPVLGGLGPFTVFAPVNEAFEALGTEGLDVLLDPANRPLLQKILTYHVVYGDVRAGDLEDGLKVETVEGSEITFDLSGATPRVNGANILATDIVAGNGVIHLIDGVLTDNLDLVDQAMINGFSTLVGAVQGAGLEETLRGDNGGSGFTVFAPTNAAFAALASLPSGDALVDVLTYHVVGAEVLSTDLSDGQVVTTVQGGQLLMSLTGDGVGITDASGQTIKVLLTDVPAANGVIHVIDGVMLPGA